MPSPFVITPKLFLKEMARAGKAPKVQAHPGVIIYLANRSLPRIEGYKACESSIYLGAQWVQLECEECPTRKITAISGIGIGAPALGFHLELAIELGARQVFIVGTAGSVNSKIKNRDLILCDSTFGADGLSKSYASLEDSDSFARLKGDPEMLGRASEVLRAMKLEHSIGPSWTTDGFFRESVADVQKFSGLGALTVEMEASAAYAIAQERNIQALAAFVVSDQIDLCDPANPNWRPGFQKLSDRLSDLLIVAIKTVTR